MIDYEDVSEELDDLYRAYHQNEITEEARARLNNDVQTLLERGGWTEDGWFEECEARMDLSDSAMGFGEETNAS